MTSHLTPRRPSSRAFVNRRIAIAVVAAGLAVTMSACSDSTGDPAMTSTAEGAPSVSREASAPEPAATSGTSAPSGSSDQNPVIGAEQVQVDQGAFVTYTNNSASPMRFWGFVGRFGEDVVTIDLQPSESATVWGWNVNPTRAAVSMKGLVCLDEECSDTSRIVIMEYSTRTVQAADRKGNKESAGLGVGQSQSFRLSDQSIAVLRQSNTANKSSQWQVTFTDPA